MISGRFKNKVDAGLTVRLYNILVRTSQFLIAQTRLTAWQSSSIMSSAQPLMQLVAPLVKISACDAVCSLFAQMVSSETIFNWCRLNDLQIVP